jgi:hypothetical protein
MKRVPVSGDDSRRVEANELPRPAAAGAEPAGHARISYAR